MLTLAEEVLLLHRCKAGVRIGAADHAELVRIHAELCFKLRARSSAPPAHTRIQTYHSSYSGLLQDVGWPNARKFAKLHLGRKER